MSREFAGEGDYLRDLVELVGIELEAFSGRELVFIEDERESAAEILSEAEGPEIGGAGRDRTDDLIVANDALSQLSYSPTRVGNEKILSSAQIRSSLRASRRLSFIVSFRAKRIVKRSV